MSEHEKITVYVGSIVNVNGGGEQDNRRRVEFVGREVCYWSEAGTHKGQLTNTRGVTYTLYETEVGQYVVHVRDWSNWQEEPTTYNLVPATLDDLGPAGKFAQLGEACNLSRPLTLAEYMKEREEGGYDE